MRTLSLLLLPLVLLALSVSAHKRGVPWGCDNRHASQPFGSLLSWYHHWADGPVPELDQQGFDYVPSYWGPQQTDKWNQRKQEMKKKMPTHLLAMNEPDVPSQSNLSPEDAARIWMQELAPYANQGVHVSTPQVCWDLDWFTKFKAACDKLGCKPTFASIHWYGSYKDFDKLQKWATAVHKLYGLPVWITEFGITAESGATQEQVNAFYINANQWFQDQGWIKRSAWLGGFAIGHAPDPYPSEKMAFMNPDGSPREILRIAGNQQHPTYTPDWFKVTVDDSNSAASRGKQKRSDLRLSTAVTFHKKKGKPAHKKEAHHKHVSH